VESRINDLDFNFHDVPRPAYAAEVLNGGRRKGALRKGRGKGEKRRIVAGNLIQGVLARRVYIRTICPRSRRTGASARSSVPVAS